MRLLYITESGTGLYHRDGRLVVARGKQVFASVPDSTVEAIICARPTHCSAAAISHCLTHGICVSFLGPRGEYRGRLVAPSTASVVLRQAQAARVLDPVFCLSFARQLVVGKIQNQRRLLLRQHWNHGLPLQDAEMALTRAARHAGHAASLDTLRGIEGDAAQRYFHALGTCLPEAFTFVKRSRRPPRDPFNALLSFLYALVLVDCLSALEVVGLDPYLGVLHQPRAGRPALALDLLEEFRAPAADRVALACVGLRLVAPEDFVHRQGEGVWLTSAAVRVVINRYAATMLRQSGSPRIPLRGRLLRQARLMRQTMLDGETPYDAFAYR